MRITKTHRVADVEGFVGTAAILELLKRHQHSAAAGHDEMAGIDVPVAPEKTIAEHQPSFLRALVGAKDNAEPGEIPAGKLHRPGGESGRRRQGTRQAAVFIPSPQELGREFGIFLCKGIRPFHQPARRSRPGVGKSRNHPRPEPRIRCGEQVHDVIEIFMGIIEQVVGVGGLGQFDGSEHRQRSKAVEVIGPILEPGTARRHALAQFILGLLGHEVGPF